MEITQQKRKINERSLANLRPIKPGEVRNPGGRPAGESFDAVIRKYLEKIDPDDPEARQKKVVLVDSMYSKAKKGDVQAATWLAQRGYGNLPIEVNSTITTVTQLVAELTGTNVDSNSE